MASPLRPPRTRVYATVLAALALLFFLRVLGQVLVAFFGVRFLPPMEDWYSGLLPYPILLPVQVVILWLQALMVRDFWRNAGFFVVPRPRMGRVVRWFSYVYLAGMIVRYTLTMSMYPERRWLGRGTIPTLFHCVLATYLFVFSLHHLRSESRPCSSPS